jgi:type IV pilus assembly protein PilW
MSRDTVKHAPIRVVRPGPRHAAAGFTLVEVMIAMALGLIVLASAVTLFQQGMDASYLVVQRAEMQQNARAAVNFMAHDLSMAAQGGFATSGIQLPSGAGSVNAVYGCSNAGCYLAGANFPNNRLYAITPGPGVGPKTLGVFSDTVVTAYIDSNFNTAQPPALTTIVKVTPGTSVVVTVNPAAFTPPLTDPTAGHSIGDVLQLCNVNGCAAGTVTAFNAAAGTITFADKDPLLFNQSSAAFGNIASLGPWPPQPMLTLSRIIMETYSIDATNPNSPRLMRQDGAHAPNPVAENIENLQLTYDVYDTNAGAATSNLPDPIGSGFTPNQIRKANVWVSARSSQQGLLRKGYERVILGTAVSPRNLSFSDRYQ